PVNVVEGAHFIQRQALIHAPDRFASFVDQALRARARCAEYERRGARATLRLSPEVAHQRGPICHRRRLQARSGIVHISSHADYLAPPIPGAFANSFAQCRGRRTPPLAREILRYYDDVSQLIQVVPAEIAACYQRNSRCPPITRRHETILPQGSNIYRAVTLILCEQNVTGSVGLHRSGTR